MDIVSGSAWQVKCARYLEIIYFHKYFPKIMHKFIYYAKGQQSFVLDKRLWVS